MRKLFAFLRLLLGINELPAAVLPPPAVRTERYARQTVRRCLCCGRFLRREGLCPNCGWKVTR